MKKKPSFIEKFKQLHQDIRKNPEKDDNYVEIAFIVEKRLTELKHQRQKRKLIRTVAVANLILILITSTVFFYYQPVEKVAQQQKEPRLTQPSNPLKPSQEPKQTDPLLQEDAPKISKEFIANNQTEPKVLPQPKAKESSAFKENEYFETLALNSKNSLSNSLSPSDYLFGESIQISLDANGASEYNLIIYNNLGDVVAEQIIQVDSTQQLQINLASEKLGLGVFYWFLENELEDFSCKFYIREE